MLINTDRGSGLFLAVSPTEHKLNDFGNWKQKTQKHLFRKSILSLSFRFFSILLKLLFVSLLSETVIV